MGSVIDTKNALRFDKLQETGIELAKRIEMETKRNVRIMSTIENIFLNLF